MTITYSPPLRMTLRVLSPSRPQTVEQIAQRRGINVTLARKHLEDLRSLGWAAVDPDNWWTRV